MTEIIYSRLRMVSVFRCADCGLEVEVDWQSVPDGWDYIDDSEVRGTGYWLCSGCSYL